MGGASPTGDPDLLSPSGPSLGSINLSYNSGDPELIAVTSTFQSLPDSMHLSLCMSVSMSLSVLLCLPISISISSVYPCLFLSLSLPFTNPHILEAPNPVVGPTFSSYLGRGCGRNKVKTPTSLPVCISANICCRAWGMNSHHPVPVPTPPPPTLVPQYPSIQ